MKKILFGIICMFSFVAFSFAAKLSFSYPQTSLVAGCPSKVDVMLDTQGLMTTTMDLKILFDPSVMSRDYFDIDGSVFKTSTLPYLSSGNGLQTSYILLSTLSRWGFNGVGRVGTITLTPKSDLATPYLHLQFAMVPNKDSDDSNVIVVSEGNAFDALNTTSQLYLPIRSGLCDDQIQEQLQKEQTALQNEVKRQELANVVLIQNDSFVSQYGSQEKRDIIMSRLVRNISRIIVVVLALALGFIGRHLAKKKLLFFKSFSSKK